MDSSAARDAQCAAELRPDDPNAGLDVIRCDKPAGHEGPHVRAEPWAMWTDANAASSHKSCIPGIHKVPANGGMDAPGMNRTCAPFTPKRA